MYFLTRLNFSSLSTLYGLWSLAKDAAHLTWLSLRVSFDVLANADLASTGRDKVPRTVVQYIINHEMF